MEVVYILISIIEIILTVFLVLTFKKWNTAILSANENFVKNTKNLDENLKNIRKILNKTAKISKIYKKWEKINSYLSKILKIKGIINAIEIIQGKRANGKFKLFPILRKILFFI